MATELAPCPFCGGAPRGPYECTPDGDIARIECHDCALSMDDTDLNRIVERWNTRPGEAQARVDERERCAKLLYYTGALLEPTADGPDPARTGALLALELAAAEIRKGEEPNDGK